MFPDFNQYSIPLLILVLQGLVFVVLLFYRYYKKKVYSDLFLGLILLLTCYYQTCYTVGFMGWYNEFRTTKINYFLINIFFGVAPLIYLYVKSITQSHFTFKKKYLWFFLPFFAFIAYRLFIFIYDALQPGFSETQNGYLKIHMDEAYVQNISWFLETAFMLVFLAFTFQLFFNYRKKIKAYFSNVYKLELNWMLSFLIVFSAFFIYGSIQDILGQFYMDIHYEQRWWLNLFVALATLYLGIKGYFTDTTKLNTLNFSFSPQSIAIPETWDNTSKMEVPREQLAIVKRLMEVDNIYLNPELNLQDFAQQAGMSRAQLSETINSGFGKNFNDFVNSYRVEAFKAMIRKNKHRQMSLIGIAEECGFNSKATFNRVFRKLTNHTPTQYLNSR